MPEESIHNNDELYRRIPNQPNFVGSPKRPPKINHKNFELREDIRETGVSVDVARLTTLDKVRNHPRAKPDNFIGVAKVEDIRNLGLKVIFTKEEGNPAHAEIQDDKVSLSDRDVREALADLFRFTEQDEKSNDSNETQSS